MPPRKFIERAELLEDATYNDTQPNLTGFCYSCIIEDNDPNVLYTGNWVMNSTSFGTIHITTEPGSTIQLQFNGSWIMAFGTIPASLPLEAAGPSSSKRPTNARYTLDSFEPVNSSVPITDTFVPIQPFFSANGLGLEEHNLTIEVLEADAETPYIFQHFFVVPHLRDGLIPGFPSPPDQAEGIPTPSPTGPSLDDLPLAERVEIPSMKPMIIILSVFGSVVTILFVVTLTLCCIHRKRMADRLSSNAISKFWSYAPRSNQNTGAIEPPKDSKD
ncbi:hypothetical protein CC1G_10999 [Coprinopsis cinerea okayama7|uniref:Uncharacterized protein n=1 Tax=Coprinopsis cinerea (strain Okayama-7 / 130 / ATCC MYA-4618 / FGSC 9003) TaxID=240176 RepID=A8P727_COPC7|nr:hypothetical protein CC1G_10999 [Coprinopsis cinerea okayama7\|eukprot:XP_001839277.1 hypothetical protein CC1G_10999 [Coprinopsis cinerea okayama7\